MINIAIFCSGNGTNLQAIINAVKNKKLKGVNPALSKKDLEKERKGWVNIALVISDNYSAFALKRAEKAGIKNIVIDPDRFQNKSEFEKDIISHLKKENIQLIVLAGFMRIIGKDILTEYKNRILNIHPALLPSFKGAHAIKDALEYGVKITGVTVHFVDEEIDHGPIILQKEVKVEENETLGSLEAKIHKVEHKLYPQAIKLVLKAL